MRIFATIFAGLLGLAFGSFLNVCLSRWPAGESIVKPASHCRACSRTLSWWENIPLLSWIFLRGRCRTCNAVISWRYPAVEFSVAILWAISAWHYAFAVRFLIDSSPVSLAILVVAFIGPFALLWLLIALATLDAENLWLPDKLTLPGIFSGVFVAALYSYFFAGSIVTPISLENFFLSAYMQSFWRDRFLTILIAAGLILLIRWIYWLVRRREGIGLGDAKLMAMLGAWLGLSGALLSFVIGVLLGALVALIALALPRRENQTWAATRLPLGTFLCIGGIIAALWGEPILNAYMRWSGL